MSISNNSCGNPVILIQRKSWMEPALGVLFCTRTKTNLWESRSGDRHTDAGGLQPGRGAKRATQQNRKKTFWSGAVRIRWRARSAGAVASPAHCESDRNVISRANMSAVLTPTKFTGVKVKGNLPAMFDFHDRRVNFGHFPSMSPEISPTFCVRRLREGQVMGKAQQWRSNITELLTRSLWRTQLAWR